MSEPNNDMEAYELFLGYFKQGDDLRDSLRRLVTLNANTFVSDEAYAEVMRTRSADAFIGHAEQLEAAARDLRRAANLAREEGLQIAAADTHYISVRCRPELGARLVAEGFLHKYDDEDDEDADADADAEDDEDEDDVPTGEYDTV